MNDTKKIIITVKGLLIWFQNCIVANQQSFGKIVDTHSKKSRLILNKAHKFRLQARHITNTANSIENRYGWQKSQMIKSLNKVNCADLSSICLCYAIFAEYPLHALRSCWFTHSKRTTNRLCIIQSHTSTTHAYTTITMNGTRDRAGHHTE